MTYFRARRLAAQVSGLAKHYGQLEKELPEVHVKDGTPLPDWRETPEDTRDDDEDKPATADVIDILGFDPDELGDGDEEA